MIDGNKLDKDSEEQADVCIVGGGVAGIVLANELKSVVGKVVLLEAGGVSYSQESQDLYQGETTGIFPNPNYSRLRFLGGSSNHWQNNTSPFDPIDFEQRDWIPDSGWPIQYKDVEPYYKRAAQYVGTGVDGYQTDHWQKQLQHRDLFSESTNIRSQIAKMAIPPVRFFHRYGQELQATDNLLIYTNMNMVDLEYQRSQQRVTAVTASSYQGIKLKVKAKIFVMCLGGLENARLLLHFNDKYDNQLGNQGGSVGRYLMEHPTIRAIHIYPEKNSRFDFYQNYVETTRYIKAFLSLTENALTTHGSTNLRIPLLTASEFELAGGVSSTHMLMDSFDSGQLPDNVSTHLLNILSDIDMVAEGIARKHFDAKLFDSADQFGGFLPAMMIEQTPDRENRIQLSGQQDVFGLKKMSINYRITESDKHRAWVSLKVLAKEFGALGLGRVKLNQEFSERIWGSQLGFSSHHMGTTRMSSGPEQGVVDASSKVFGTNNFYVAGSSVFTTGSHVPPTLTICALSIRLAEHIKGELNYGEA